MPERAWGFKSPLRHQRNPCAARKVGCGWSGGVSVCHTVVLAIVWPSRASSPCIRRCPHVGFSLARRTTSWRSSASMGGRPVRRVGGWVQCLAIRWRCHRSRVSGVTIQPWRSWRGSVAAMAPSRVRSSSMSAGRPIWRRSTVFWWRSTMSSRSLDRPERTASRARSIRSRWRMRDTSNQDGGICPGQHPRATFRAGQGVALRLYVRIIVTCQTRRSAFRMMSSRSSKAWMCRSRGGLPINSVVMQRSRRCRSPTNFLPTQRWRQVVPCPIATRSVSAWSDPRRGDSWIRLLGRSRQASSLRGGVVSGGAWC